MIIDGSTMLTINPEHSQRIDYLTLTESYSGQTEETKEKTGSLRFLGRETKRAAQDFRRQRAYPESMGRY